MGDSAKKEAGKTVRTETKLYSSRCYAGGIASDRKKRDYGLPVDIMHLSIAFIIRLKKTMAQSRENVSWHFSGAFSDGILYKHPSQ